jgi:hypothetical protein
MGLWLHKVRLKDVFHNDDLSFEERRDETVRRFNLVRRHHFPEDLDLELLLEELAEAPDPDEFDIVWDSIYDWCDDYRVWVETI